MKHSAIRALLAGALVAGGLSHLAIAADAIDAFVLQDLAPARLEEAREAFVRDNPTSPWTKENVRVFPKTGFVSHALGRAAGEPTPEAAITLARAFLAHNRDRLGLRDVALESLAVRFQKSALGNVFVESPGSIAYPGYEMVTDFGYRVRLTLQVDAQSVRSVINQTDRLPYEFPRLHKKPLVPFQAQAILDKMIGREMFYYDIAGRRRSAGKVVATDIEGITLTVSREHREDGSEWVGLTWRYRVLRNSLPWTFVFSARTGELVALHQNFAT